jgi:hypothetical protein
MPCIFRLASARFAISHTEHATGQRDRHCTQFLRAKQFQAGGQSADNDWNVVKKLHVASHEKQRQELAR